MNADTPRGAQVVDTLKLLSDLSRDIALTSENVASSLETLLARASTSMHADALAVWTIDDEADTLSIRHAVGLSPRFVRYFNHTDRIRLGKGLLGVSAKDAATRTIEKQESWSELGPTRWIEMFHDEGIVAMETAAMKIGERPLGVLTAIHKKEHAYDMNERFFYEVLANQVAIALANYTNYQSIATNREELKDQISKLTHMQDAFQEINRSLNQSVSQALNYLAKYTQETFRAMGVAVFEPNEERTALHMTGSSGLPEHFEKALGSIALSIIEPTDSLVARSFLDKKSYLTERFFTDDRIGRKWMRVLSENQITAAAEFPLMVEDRIFGVFIVYYDHLHPYPEEETSVLGAFSQFFGILFENQKIFASLIAEKQKTQAIVYSLHDGLVVYDLENKIIDINPRGTELLGLSRADALGKNPSELETANPGLKSLQEVSRLAIPDFESRPVILTFPHDTALKVTQVPLHQENYHKTGSIRILHDVTDEHRSEQLKTNFVSTATHQLRTPLTGIRWGLSSLASGEGGELNERQSELVHKLTETTSNIISLINDLLDVSQIEEGKRQYEFKKQRIEPIVQEVVKEIIPQFEFKHLAVTVDIPPESEVPPVMIDEVQMKLALQNLIDNAFKYTPAGGAVEIRIHPAPNSLVISVKDNGIGIPKEDQRLLFNKFFRAENAVRIETSGSGLGLFLAKKITEDHNGKLSVDSATGRGSTFFIQLPLSEDLMPKKTPIQTVGMGITQGA
ncbi:hypothetical protein A3A41_01055 [Candidatus Kaiserbacteria bacterium RIFCSPLOWO2_01_FULL_54_22]|nr:MAG: hypothetical protein A3A41_01055 [Candidatus Kaiserbacteria bacterium RIFCSPLOWO2_01_FULL_54_22]